MRRVQGEKLLLTYRHACLVREFGGTEYRRVPKSSRSRLSLARQKTLCFCTGRLNFGTGAPSRACHAEIGNQRGRV